MADADSLSLYRAVPDDAETYFRLARDTFYDSYASMSDPAVMSLHLHRSFSQDKQRQELEDPDTTVLVAVNSKASWVGFATVRRESAPVAVKGNPSLYVSRLYVVREWHGHGAGAFLLNAAMEEGRKAGYKSLWLLAWEKNARARRFYAKHGFAEVGRHPYRFGDDWEDDLVLELLI